jgi:hypothetical protein
MKTIITLSAVAITGFVVGFFTKDYMDYKAYKQRKDIFESKFRNKFFNRKYKGL